MVMRRTEKPRAFVVAAASLVTWVRGVTEILAWVTGRLHLTNAFVIPDPQAWRRLYRSNRRLARRWASALRIEETSPIWKELTDRKAVSPATVFPPSQAGLEELLLEFVGGVTQSSWAALLNSPEAQFLIRVWIPCGVIYREGPARLLRRARQGDDDAFDALLRLDKTTLSDPVLWQRWQVIMNDPKRSRRTRFERALGGRPAWRFDEKTIRIAMAGLLSQVAERDGCDMTAPEIREWFASFEGGWLPDDAMPGGEALTKAIQRNKNWPTRKRDSK